MSNDKVEALRKKQIGLKNTSIEAEHRPSDQAVVIRPETLSYYQKLEGMLEDALDLAGQEKAPIVTVDAGEVKRGIEEAVAGVLQRLTGIEMAGRKPALPPPLLRLQLELAVLARSQRGSGLRSRSLGGGMISARLRWPACTQP